MRHLYLIRHAEAANRLPHQTDLDRTLTAKGLKDAQRVGLYLREHKLERIYYSNAVRTTQTAFAINDALRLSHDSLVKSTAIYHADVITLLELIQSIEEEVHFVAVVAHNPTVSALASELSIDRVPSFSPGQVVALAFEVDSWREVRPESSQLDFVYDPSK
ncbi:MAG: phosphohistidine phosphatase SixA [Flammeovirgaceae bacterium]